MIGGKGCRKVLGHHSVTAGIVVLKKDQAPDSAYRAENPLIGER